MAWVLLPNFAWEALEWMSFTKASEGIKHQRRVLQTMPMFFFRYEARPKETNPKRDVYGGAMVNCWVVRDTEEQAAAVARGWIGDADWRITRLESAVLMTKEDQAEYPDGMKYFEQAEIDREVFVFYTWPVDASEEDGG